MSEHRETLTVREALRRYSELLRDVAPRSCGACGTPQATCDAECMHRAQFLREAHMVDALVAAQPTRSEAQIKAEAYRELAAKLKHPRHDEHRRGLLLLATALESREAGPFDVDDVLARAAEIEEPGNGS